MTSEEKEFIQYCLANNLIQPSQLQQVLLKHQKSTRSLLKTIATSLHWSEKDVEKIQNNIKTASENKEPNSNQITQTHHPKNEEAGKNIAHDLLYAREILIRGIANIEEINQCLQEKYSSGVKLSLLQMMVRNHKISIDKFLKINKELEMFTREEILQRHQRGPQLILHQKGDIPVIEQKQGGAKFAHYQIVQELGRGGMGWFMLLKIKN